MIEVTEQAFKKLKEQNRLEYIGFQHDEYRDAGTSYYRVKNTTTYIAVRMSCGKTAWIEKKRLSVFYPF